MPGAFRRCPSCLTAAQSGDCPPPILHCPVCAVRVAALPQWPAMRAGLLALFPFGPPSHHDPLASSRRRRALLREHRRAQRLANAAPTATATNADDVSATNPRLPRSPDA